MKKWIRNLLLALGLLVGVSQAGAQGTTAFTYQGQLHDSGTNANGAYTMVFTLYDAPGSGNQIGTSISNSVTLANGLFTVNLDFGSSAFDGTGRWLDIKVGFSGGTETLSPRVPVLPVPYALYSASAGSLASGSWNASVGNYQSFNNVLGIYASNSLVLGVSPNGILVNGGVQANGFALGQNESISDDGNGGFSLSAGNSNANLTINNLTLNGDSIQFPAQSGANLQVSANGDFVFDSNVRITALGVVHVPTPDGSSVGLTGYGFGAHTLIRFPKLFTTARSGPLRPSAARL
jgi:hypothetical protein